jgi:hypothetical protein
MGIVKVSRNIITPDDKKKAIDIHNQSKILKTHRFRLIIALGVSICINVGLIVKLLIN